jgi:hypothetical protein
MTRVTEEAEKKEKPVSRAQMEREVAAVRKQVHDILEKAHARSEKSGKPLLIMVGENHGSANSALLETIIYQKARSFGVKDLAFELPSRGEKSAELKKILNDAIIARPTMSGSLLVFKQSLYFGDNQHFVDGRAEEALKTKLKTQKDIRIESRNETIAANLAKIEQPVLLVTGSLHLAGLNNLMNAHATHEVVIFDVGNDKFHRDPLKEMTKKEAAKFKCIDAKNIDLSYNCNKLTADNLLRLGLGNQAADFIHWAESSGKKEPQEKIRAAVKYAEHHKPQNPSSDWYAAYSNALYEIGMDKEAGKYHALGAIAASKNSKKDERHYAAKTAGICGHSSEFIESEITETLKFSDFRKPSITKTDWHTPLKNPTPHTPEAPTFSPEWFKHLGIAPSNHLPYSDAPRGVPLAPVYHPPVQAKDKSPEAPKMAKPAPKGWSFS